MSLKVSRPPCLNCNEYKTHNPKCISVSVRSHKPKNNVPSLTEIREANPLFFERKTMRFHHTKAIKKRRHLIMLKNMVPLPAKPMYPVYQADHTTLRLSLVGYAVSWGNWDRINPK